VPGFIAGYTENYMNRSSYLLGVLGLAWAGFVLAQDPPATGTATGSTTTASGVGTALPPTEALLVGGAAIVGTAVGLSSDGDGNPLLPSTSTSTATATAPAP
jgi:hypothetical protein